MGNKVWGVQQVCSPSSSRFFCAAFFSPPVSLLMHLLLEALSTCWLGSERPGAFAGRVWTWWELLGSWLPSGALGPGRATCAVFPDAWGCRGNGEGGRGKPGSWSWASQARTSLLIDSVSIAQTYILSASKSIGFTLKIYPKPGFSLGSRISLLIALPPSALVPTVSRVVL